MVLAIAMNTHVNRSKDDEDGFTLAQACLFHEIDKGRQERFGNGRRLDEPDGVRGGKT